MPSGKVDPIAEKEPARDAAPDRDAQPGLRALRRFGLARVIDALAALRDQRLPGHRPAESAAAKLPTSTVLVDDPVDTAWTSKDPRFARLVHVFHQEWHGIRAAAGYLPGRKLAITTLRPLTRSEAERAVDACSDADCVVIHSSSANATKLARLLRRRAGGAVRIHAIWHGSTSQFHYQPELAAFNELLSLRRDGLVDRLGCVKPGMHLLSSLIHGETLLNLPPSSLAPRPRQREGAALLPLPNDWRKNLFTNLFAADGAQGIRDVFVTASITPPSALPLRCRLVEAGQLGRWQLFRLLERIDILMNATLSECQPMTALEALAMHVPCVTGRLGLGALDAHPYQQLSQVAEVDSIESVRAAADRLLALRWQRPEEFRPMAEDYRADLERVALQRLGEFVAA